MQTIFLRSLALFPLLLGGSCSFDRGFRFYGEYEAEQSHFRIQLISQGYVKPGDDLPSGEWNRRTSERWLKEALSQAGYRDIAEEELKGSMRVMGSSLAGPKGVILKGQIKSLIVRRADIVYGYKVMKDRPPREWIGSSELPSCSTF